MKDESLAPKEENSPCPVGRRCCQHPPTGYSYGLPKRKPTEEEIKDVGLYFWCRYWIKNGQ
jgi:hypothetical protein